MSVREFACALLLAAAALAVPARARAQAMPPAASDAPVGDEPAAPPPPETAPLESNPPAAPPPSVPPGPQSPGQPEDAVIVETSEREPVARPRLYAAVGFGSSFDAVGFNDGSARAIPAFVSELGIGDGPFGFDLLAFASQAAGRHENQTPVDRLAVDLFGVIRPGAWFRPGDPNYGIRLLHGLGAELGLGFERDGVGAVSGTRFLIHTGARADVPLTPAREPTQLRLRLAVRRGIGLYTPRISGGRLPGVIEVDDSAVELYAALVAVF